MEKTILSLIFVFVFSQAYYAQNYKQIKISLQDKDNVSELVKFDIDLEHAEWTKDNELILFVSDEEFLQLSLLNFKIEILINDWMEYFKSLPVLSESEKSSALRESREKFNVTGFGYGSLAGFYTVAEVNAKLDSMRSAYPHLITAKQSIGTTIEGRQVYVVKISDNPDLDEGEPEILYTAMIHAREPQAMMQMIYFMYYLLENYGTNPDVTYIVNNRALYFIPVINPDGYIFNQTSSPSGGGMWRKNRRNNGGSFGVDLNRNYGPEVYWNAPNGGSSTSPTSDTYRGTAPFSEPETQNIRDFLLSRNFKNALNYHTYSNLLIYPYGALSRETPDSATFREFANDMVAYNGYMPGTDIQTVGYSTRGNSDDYFYDGNILAQGKIFAMTPEVGSSSDGFWPPQSRIFPLAQENVMPNLYYAYVTGALIKHLNVSFDRQYFNPGDQNIQLNIPTIRNKGLGNAQNLTVQLVSLESFITVQSGTLNLPSIPARTSIANQTPFAFSISASAPTDYLAKMVLRTSLDGTVMSTDTIKIIIGTPSFAFVDTTNNPANLWAVTSTPTMPKWEATTSSFYSSPNSYSDSPTGNYLANATVTLTSTQNINLAGLNNPRLSFWTRHDIETKWDCGVVLASSNGGTTWNALTGLYTKAASGSGKQVPTGMPIYDGVRSSWVREEINLSSYAGQQIKLRFELRTDGSIEKDGWYVDDIGVYTYGVVPVELISLSAVSDGKNINIGWETKSETNNRGFYIERSSDNNNWEKLGFIPGKGSTTDQQKYLFSDSSPLKGKNIYKLQQIDFDGSIIMAGKVESDFSPVYEFNLEQNYPNPFNPSTVIKWQSPVAGWQILKIYDVLGNEVVVLIDEFRQAGNHEVEFTVGGGNLKNLSSGIYFYRIAIHSDEQRANGKSGNEFVSTKKLMLLK